jgi:TolB-like protein
MAVIAVFAGTALFARWRRPESAPLRPRVLINVFENRTGDPALQPVGRMAQDWLAQGIARAGLVDVVDPRAVFVQTHQAAGAAVDASTLARRTGAALIVSGSFYRTGDTLFVQAAVTDAATSRIVRAVGPILATVQNPVGGLDELRSRVTTALASVVDRRATQELDQREVPPFDVYEAYVEGWDAYWHGAPTRAESLFASAAHGDTAFTLAALAVAVVAANSNECARVDSLARALDVRHTALTQVDRLTLQIADARCRGRNDAMLQLTLERADLEPGNSSDQMSAAAAALWANRPQQALALLQRVNPATDLAWSTDTTHFAYWSSLTEALHALDRHREELEATASMTPRASLSRVWLRGSALAALSRGSEVLALLDSAETYPVETTADLGLAPYTDGRPQYTVTFGWVANWIARELAYHGDSAAARQAARRAVAWYRARPPDERATVEERLVAAWSLEMTGAYADAERVARGLVAEDSDNVDFRGELAGLAAECGDTLLADSLDRWLAAQPPSRVGWSASVYRARVAALLGRSDSAVARTRDAFDEGMWPRWLHQEPGLARLRSRADFAALTKLRQ